MWERGNFILIRLTWVVMATLVVLLGVIIFSWNSDSEIPKVETVSTKPLVKEMVDVSWANRAAINDALLTDNSTKNNLAKNIISKSTQLKSPKAGPKLSSTMGQIQSAALRQILGLEGDGTYQTRRRALVSLKAPLNATDQQWLYGFLASTADIEGLSKPAEYALKDGLMVFLAADANTLPQTVEVLRQMYLDSSQDPIIRNYAVQYLASSVSALSDGAQKAAIQELLFNLAADSNSVVSGTAILGLNRLSENDPSGLNAKRIGEIALAAARNNTLPQMQRMCPLQVCGLNGIQEAAPIARDLAVNGTSVMVRMAALATLGELGGAGDRPLLTQATADQDERIRKAASVALIRLNSKLNQ